MYVQRETKSRAAQHTTHNHNQAHSEQRMTHTQETRHAATAPKLTERSNSLNILNYNFSKEHCMLPDDDRVIETCRSVLNVLI